MTTAFASIVGAVVASLQAAPPVTDHVYRVRLRPLSASVSAACVVRPGPARRDGPVGQGTASIWASQFTVECYARAAAGQEPDLAVDSLLEAVHDRLMADPSLGGLVGGIDLAGLDYDFDAEAEQAACVVLTFTVQHATAAGQLH